MTLEYEKLRAKAAKWLLDSKDRAMWWSWLVLTSKNPDTTNPDIPEVSAFNIFIDLSYRKLLEPFEIDTSQGNVGVHKLNLANSEAWKEVTDPPGWLLKKVRWFATNWGWLVSLVFSALLGAYFKSLFDRG
jgi:hypothetical protein